MSRLSLRTRFSLLYGGLFLLVGAILLLVNWLLVAHYLPDASRFAGHAENGTVSGQNIGPPAQVGAGEKGTDTILVTSISDYRSSAVQTVITVGGFALLLTGALAVLFGWLMAGRVLQPVHAITATARRLEADNLDRRINLEGPPGELKELADTFDSMLDRLASTFDSQRRFVSNASHELRTPLAVQRTLVDVAMADPDVSPDVLRLGRQLLQTNERSERIIEGLLVLARSDRGLATSAPVRLDDVANLVLDSMAGLASEHDVTLHRTLTPRTVLGEQVLLERLVSNLVHNAILYNEAGGTVRVSVDETPALVVENTGPPVPAEFMPSLFEPFRRLAGDRTGSTNGAGLGLSIVRSIASAHHGSVRAEPGQAGGLRVVVTLPTAPQLP
ncbi:sensor histidine kinase [Amycolatopsis taiwanensis]|uniref:histidine kinase n=1 Tax=Amycolatopsis taiwanensis TaxID=342230 RepID=A0A9W6QYV5_9PSEU|nr:ATP-binding protein [Amycolatopsis taiwanensis]GLY64527.1 two-component sensor histidine kinase [Amycolatopsis taiwanensis]